jgi:hypothetical protein
MKVVLALVVAAALPVLAHHSIMATYDPALPVSVHGTVTRFLFRNPHSFVSIDEARKDGTNIHWDVELPPGGMIGQKGWTRDTLRPGDVLTFSGFRGKGNAQRAIAAEIVLADGRILESWPPPGGGWMVPTLEEFKAKAH